MVKLFNQPKTLMNAFVAKIGGYGLLGNIVYGSCLQVGIVEVKAAVIGRKIQRAALRR